MQTPSLVDSHLQIPQHRLTWQQGIPFIVQQQLQSPSQSDWQRFCNVPQATSSSHEQVSFMPPLHFSIFIVQRGSIIMVPIAGAAADWVWLVAAAMGFPIAVACDGPR
jgi:hypothetical protein